MAGFHKRLERTRQSGYNNGKSGSSGQDPVAQPPIPPKCPECTSQRVWRDGMRRTSVSDVQRWICRSCGYRFSQPRVEVHVRRQATVPPKPVHDLGNLDPVHVASTDKGLEEPTFTIRKDIASHKFTSVGKAINTLLHNSRERQVCVTEREAKNLAQVETRPETAQRESTTLSTDIKGLLAVYIAKSELQGLDAQTIRRRVTLLKLLQKRGGNLLNPESVFHVIDGAKKWDWKRRQLTGEPWSDGSKNNAAQAYRSFCELHKIPIPEGINLEKWGRQPQKLPWVPLETEIDQLIAGCLRLIATFLQLLKETGMRSGEAIRLTWADVDLEHGVVTINRPEKHSLPRQFKISGKLLAMLNCLPKENEKVFTIDLRTMRKRFMWQRNRISQKLQNPRIKRITFHTLRHWYGTMEYHKTKDILRVQDRLGHKSITSTLIYTHLVNFEADEYHTATSKSLKEDEELLKAGFEYVTERDGVKIYRKRK